MSATTIKIDQQVVNAARIHGAALNRRPIKRVEFWSRIGKIAKENPDANLNLLIGLEQVKAGMFTEYQFG
jgi:hypothetical protein